MYSCHYDNYNSTCVDCPVARDKAPTIDVDCPVARDTAPNNAKIHKLVTLVYGLPT